MKKIGFTLNGARAVREMKGISLGERGVLYDAVVRAGIDGTFWIKIPTWADALGVSERSLKGYTASLIKKGLLERTRRMNRCNLYRLTFLDGANIASSDGQKVPPEPDEGANIASTNGQIPAPTDGQPTAQLKTASMEDSLEEEFSAGEPAESDPEGKPGGISMKDMSKLYGIVEAHFKKTKGRSVKWTTKNKTQFKSWAIKIAGDEPPDKVLRLVLENWYACSHHIKNALGYSFVPDEFKVGYLLEGAGESVDWYRMQIECQQPTPPKKIANYTPIEAKLPQVPKPNPELAEIFGEDEA